MAGVLTSPVSTHPKTDLKKRPGDALKERKGSSDSFGTAMDAPSKAVNQPHQQQQHRLFYQSTATPAGMDLIEQLLTRNTSSTPSMPMPSGSPGHQARSPRCEAFLMTGDKMLNLNPKISPCYAKLCQGQLPPTVEIDAEEGGQQHNHHEFGAFPSMAKNGHTKQQLDVTLTAENDDDTAAQNVPEAEDLTPQKDGPQVGAVQTVGGPSQGPPKAAFSDSTGNVVPADPSNQRCYCQLSMGGSQQPEKHQKTGESAVDEQKMAQNCDKTLMARFMSSSSASQNTPTSPARTAMRVGGVESGTDTEMDRKSAEMMPLVKSSTFSPETVARLATHLFTHQEGIKIAAFLVKSDDLSLRIAHEFVGLFNFAGTRIDAALRTFLSHVCLTGESGERAQLLSHFSQRYFECNPTVFNCPEEIHALTCALLLLNTDLHGKQNGKRMSCRDFIHNLAHTNNKYDAALLKELYAAVRSAPFHYKPGDEPLMPVPSATIGLGREKRLSRVVSAKASLTTCSSSAVALINPGQQVDYKHGWLLKKSLYDGDGRRTPRGRRKWQMLYATVRGMVLYLHKDENSFSSSSHYVTFRNCLLLHHSLAELPRDYTKRKNVFRLRTANLGEFLFQSSDPGEVQRWVDTLNYVAAAFSTPALPTPVGVNGVVAFYRPHLPSGPTHLSIPDQLRAHEQRLEETTSNVARLRENAPPMKARGKAVYDYFYKERFLDKERERYAVYAHILREKLALAPTSSSTLRCDSLSTNTICCTAAAGNKGQQKAIGALAAGEAAGSN